MQTRFKRLSLVLILMLGLITFCLGTISNGLNAASPIPSPPATFYVLDEAQVISSQVEDLIISVNQDLAAKTKAQIVVVTLRSSEDRPLEELGLGILRDWGVGDRELNNGLVMLVIPEERKSRIEVGYGLEGALPDGKTGRIQDDYMIPYFKQNDYNQGILNGFLALAQETANEYQVTLNMSNQQPERLNSQPTGNSLSTWQIILIVLGLVLLYFLDRQFFDGFIFGLILSMLFRGGGGGWGGGGGFSGGGGSGGGGGSSREW
ncbi:MAG: TPM domain-containing protein [Bacillota bacterium]|jgi:uncharacterized protein